MQSTENRPEYFLIISSDNITPHCSYNTLGSSNRVMSEESFKKAVQFSDRNGLKPFILNKKALQEVHPLDMPDHVSHEELSFLPIYSAPLRQAIVKEPTCIYVTGQKNLSHMNNDIIRLSEYHERINVAFFDIADWNTDSIKIYRQALFNIIPTVLETYYMQTPLQLNVLNDSLFDNSPVDCGAGKDTICVAPNEVIYACPAYYFNGETTGLGTLDDEYSVLLSKLPKSATPNTCDSCKADHSSRCIFLEDNYRMGTSNAPDNLCTIRQVESEAANILLESLNRRGLIDSKHNTKMNVSKM